MTTPSRQDIDCNRHQLHPIVTQGVTNTDCHGTGCKHYSWTKRICVCTCKHDHVMKYSLPVDMCGPIASGSNGHRQDHVSITKDNDTLGNKSSYLCHYSHHASVIILY